MKNLDDLHQELIDTDLFYYTPGIRRVRLKETSYTALPIYTYKSGKKEFRVEWRKLTSGSIYGDKVPFEEVFDLVDKEIKVKLAHHLDLFTQPLNLGM